VLGLRGRLGASFIALLFLAFFLFEQSFSFQPLLFRSLLLFGRVRTLGSISFFEGNRPYFL